MQYRTHVMYFSCYLFHVGAGAVEFIICHAEVKIAFVEEKKIPEVISNCE